MELMQSAKIKMKNDNLKLKIKIILGFNNF